MKLPPFFSLYFLLLAACVPTLGSHLTGKEELAKMPFPDINTVPFGEKAFVSRGWHPGEEEALRQKDQAHLEKERLRLQEEGAALRAQVFGLSTAS